MSYLEIPTEMKQLYISEPYTVFKEVCCDALKKSELFFNYFEGNYLRRSEQLLAVTTSPDHTIFILEAGSLTVAPGDVKIAIPVPLTGVLFGYQFKGLTIVPSSSKVLDENENSLVLGLERLKSISSISSELKVMDLFTSKKNSSSEISDLITNNVELTNEKVDSSKEELMGFEAYPMTELPDEITYELRSKVSLSCLHGERQDSHTISDKYLEYLADLGLLYISLNEDTTCFKVKRFITQGQDCVCLDTSERKEILADLESFLDDNELDVTDVYGAPKVYSLKFWKVNNKSLILDNGVELLLITDNNFFNLKQMEQLSNVHELKSLLFSDKDFYIVPTISKTLEISSLIFRKLIKTKDHLIVGNNRMKLNNESLGYEVFDKHIEIVVDDQAYTLVEKY